MLASADLTEFVKRSWLDFSTLKVFISAWPVVSTTNCASTSPSTLADLSMSGYRGCGEPGAVVTCFSTWNSKYGWSVFTGAVPPTTPLLVPPATPLPEKSASSVTFLFRSMSGSTSGTLTGAVSTWNPFGGGGAITTSFGGGGTSFGGGGSSFFLMSTNSTFSALGFSNCSLACNVPYTAAVPRTAWKIPLMMRPPVVRCFFGFDSIRLLNMSAQTY